MNIRTKSNPMIIDCHIHIHNLNAIDEFAKIMTTHKTKAVIQGSDWFREKPEHRNKLVFEAYKRYPEIIIPFTYIKLGGKNPDTPETIVMWKDRGTQGLKAIIPQKNYDDDAFFPLYEKAEVLNLPILFHTGLIRRFTEKDISLPLEIDIASKRMRPINLERISKNFPNLKIIMAHLGTQAWRHEAAYILRWTDNIYSDLSGTSTFGKIRPMKLAKFLNWTTRDWDSTYSGFRKILFGSDAKVGNTSQFFTALAAYKNFFYQLGVPEDIQHEIMYLNTARILGIEPAT